MPKDRSRRVEALRRAQRTDAFLFDPDELVLETDNGQPLFDPRVNLPVDEDLVRNIMAYGVIEPIVFKMNGEDVVVVDGRRRTLAARVAKHRLEDEGKEGLRVPGVRRRGQDEDLFGVTISANGFRHQDSPIELAKKAQRMLTFGKTPAEVQVAFGWKDITLKTHLKLLEAAPVVRQAVERGVVSVSAAGKIASAPVEEQKGALDKLLASGKPTVKKANGIVRKTDVVTLPRKVRIAELLKEQGDPFAKGAAWARGILSDDEVSGYLP